MKIYESIYQSKLDLSNQELKNFPKEILEMKNLETLILSGNKIGKIPREIIKLKRLKVLDLSNNNIDHLFSNLFSLTRLTTLCLNNNQLSHLPKQLGNLKNLNKLQLSNNKLQELPPSFLQLENLRELSLSGNNFNKFPREILYQKNLQRLWFSNLHIEDFPVEEICSSLKKLKCFYCFSSNKLNPSVNQEYKKLSRQTGNCLAKIKEINSKSTSKMDASIKENVFISYSHKDIKILERLKIHLKTLDYLDDKFEFWDDTKINAGDNWKEEIDIALKNSIVAILLISTDFLASNFIKTEELPVILEKASKNGTRILQLNLSKTIIKKIPALSKFQMVNNPDTPLSALNEAQKEDELHNLLNILMN